MAGDQNPLSEFGALPADAATQSTPTTTTPDAAPKTSGNLLAEFGALPADKVTGESTTPQHPELQIQHGFVPIDKTTGKAAEPGAWNSLKRNVHGLLFGMYHAFADPATDQEKQELLQEVRDMNRRDPKNAIPEDLASNPSRGTLAYHRLIHAPAEVAWEKGQDEQKAAEELWKNRDYWRGGNAYLSGLADKYIGAVPFVGPAVTGAAERIEKGDIPGGVTDVATLVGLEQAHAGAKKVIGKVGAAAPAMGEAYEAGGGGFKGAMRAAGVAAKAATESAPAQATAQAAGTVASAAKKVGKALATPGPETPEEAAGRIFQAKEGPEGAEGDRTKTVAAMQALKEARGTIADLDTPQKIHDALEKQVQDNTAQVDSLLSQQERVYTPDELESRHSVQSSAGQGVEVRNPALDAMDDLQNYYDGMRDIESKAKIMSLKNKFTSQGLTLQELNQVARDLGSNLMDEKAYDKNGNLRTGQNARALEKTRSDLKEIVRERMPDDDVRKLDEVTSHSIRARVMIDKVITDIQAINNKIQRAPGYQKVIAGGVKIADALTGKVMSTIIQQLTKGSAETMLNAQQLGEQLPKTIRVLDEMLEPNVRPEEVLRQVQVMTAPEELGPKAQGAEEAAPANLPLKFDEPYLPGKGRAPRGWDTKAVLNHELGHVVVAHKVGFNPIDVWSEAHPRAGNNLATTQIHWGDLEAGRSGQLPLDRLRTRLDDVVTAALGGAAANELYDNISIDENQGLSGDMRQIREVAKLLGMTDAETNEVIRNSFNRAKSILADEKVTDIVNEFSDTREPNLPHSHHYSAARVLNLLDRVDEATNEGNETRTTESGAEQRAAGESRGAGAAEAGVAGAITSPQGLAATTAPEAISTGSPELDKIIKEAGAIPGGLEKGDADANVPDMVYFHDPTTGSTAVLAVADVTPEAVKAELAKTRAQFAAKNVGEKQAKIESAAMKGQPEWVQASLEREIQRAKNILRNPEATPEEKDYAQRLLDTSRELAQHPALANLNLTDEWSGKASDFVSEDFMDPEQEEDEMYHVTTAKDKVLAEGLKSRRQTGSVGLGGGIQNAAPGKVSVTFDPGHAATIEDRMKLAVEAARDEITPRQALDRILRENMYADKTPYEVAGVLGAPKEIEEGEWEAFDKWFDETYKSGDAYEVVQRLDDGLSQIYPEAENPVRVGFTADKEQMAKVDPKQIDTFRVEARKGAKAEHVGEERELRFAPEDLRVVKN